MGELFLSLLINHSIERRNYMSNIVTIKTKLANRQNYGSVRSTSIIKALIFHFTANDGDTDEANATYFANNVVKASAHYFVDDDSITISVPENYVAYSVGGEKWSDCGKTGGGKMYGKLTNTNTISIEMCDTIKNGKYEASEKTQKNAIDLAVVLLNKYNLTPNDIYRHFDVNGKHCPVYLMDDTAWKKFKNKVKDAYNKANNSSTSSSSSSSSSTSTKKTETSSTSNTYDVKSGDTLSTIGKKLNIDWKKIAEINNIKSPYTIKPDQVLKLPTSSSSTSTKKTETKKDNGYTQDKFIKDVCSILGVDSAKDALQKTVTISASTNKSHKLVTPLERYFKELGYYTGEVEADNKKTPIFGSGMTAATKKYQKDVVKATTKNQDGIISSKAATWKKLLGV